LLKILIDILSGFNIQKSFVISGVEKLMVSYTSMLCLLSTINILFLSTPTFRFGIIRIAMQFLKQEILLDFYVANYHPIFVIKNFLTDRLFFMGKIYICIPL